MEPRHDDSISLIMNRANSLLEELNTFFDQINEALGEGTETTEIGKIIGSVQKTLAGAETLPGTVDQTVNDAKRILEDVYADIKPIIANIADISSELNDPDGFLYSVLDTDKDVYANLVKSLGSVSGILDGLDKSVAFIPGQLPQLAGIIMDLRVTLKTAEDVLVALTNNPLLRGGIPEKVQTQDGGTSPRDIRF